MPSINLNEINISQDILKNKYEKHKKFLNSDKYGEFDYPVDDDNEEDIDPYLGIITNHNMFK